MAISFSCLQCGKKLKAPDNAAGKSSKCPGCGASVTCPEPIYDAELVETTDAGAGGLDPYGDLDADKPYAMTDAGPATATASGNEARRPCPMCGEMIMATAAKCRFCGEVFDPSIKKLKKKGKGGKAKLASIASSQRSLIICIFLQLCLYIGLLATTRGNNNPPEAGAAIVSLCLSLGMIGAAIAGTIFAFRLAIQIHNTGMGIFLGILTLIPCLGFIVLLTINSSATRMLRDSGHHVGFMGADMSEF